MPIKLLHVRSGAACDIYALAYPHPDYPRDPCPALAFIAAQAGNPKELLKLTALLSRVADYGAPEDETKFRELSGCAGLYEFKTSGGLRLLCFKDGYRMIVCIHGVPKLTKKKFKGELTTAENCRTEYYTAKANKTLLYGPRPKT